jgi:hypothetical protein
MPELDQNETVLKAVNPLDQPEKFILGEIGALGLQVFSGIPQTELKRELQFPHSITTFKQMQYHDAINSALTLYDNIIAKAQWKFNPPKDATKSELKQVRVINESLHDMEHSFGEFISDVLTMNAYGFSVHEKVYRKRLKANGSKYDDGLIAWRKLPIRSQESISKFLFSEDGSSIEGVQQSISGLNDPYGRYSSKSGYINIPASKMLLFRQGKHRGDPCGKSLLRNAYLAWRFITILEELEAVGVNKELHGVPLLKIPAQYLSADASTEQKAIRSYYENAIRNMQAGAQAGIVLPQVFDPDTKQPLFDLTLLSTDGKRSFDIDKIKTYYKNAIYTALAADILILGQGSTGSFALAQFKNSVTATAARHMANLIKDTLERDLIRQTYELNGWNVERMGTLDFDGMDDIDLEGLSKAIQRFSSVDALEKDRDMLNLVRVSVGADPLPDDLEPQKELMGKGDSRSGDGFTTVGPGTSNNVASTDTSSNNMDNTA